MTALDIIKRALRLLGVYSIGEQPSSDEAQDCLTALNSMLGTMSMGSLIYAKSLDTIALAASVASVTVGPTGTTVTTRPVRVLSDSYITLSGVSYPLELFTLQVYNDIGVKSSEGIPAGIWPQMDMPDITVTMWPVPSQAMTLNLWSEKLIASFPTLVTTVTLPPGYDEMLAFALAETVAPEYDVEPSRQVRVGAARARRVIKRNNFQAPLQSFPTIVAGPFVTTYQEGA